MHQQFSDNDNNNKNWGLVLWSLDLESVNFYFLMNIFIKYLHMYNTYIIPSQKMTNKISKICGSKFWPPNSFIIFD